MGLTELAKQIGIQLTADAIVSITNRLDKLKKEKKVGTGGKTISDQDKIAVIKAYVGKKPTMREVAGGITGGAASGIGTSKEDKTRKRRSLPYTKDRHKGGGKIKTYAKGSRVRKPKY